MTQEEIAALENQPRDYMGEMLTIQHELAKTDYIFSKCKEYEVVGKPQPYTQEFLNQLSDEKDKLRDRYNALEVELNAQN